MASRAFLENGKIRRFAVYLSLFMIFMFFLQFLNSIQYLGFNSETSNSLWNTNTPEEYIKTPESSATQTVFENLTTLTSLFEKSDEFFASEQIHEIFLEFEDENWYDTLYQSHQNDAEGPYFPVTFKYQDFEAEIGINMKGHSSFQQSGTKKSFRLDFNEYNQSCNFYGLQKLNLNNGFSDPTMLREKIFWDVANEYVPTIRCSFAKVFINGEYYGFYTVVEQIDDVFFESRFGSHEDGNLYRAETAGTLEYLGDSQDQYSSKYELKNNEEFNDYSDLISLTKALNQDITKDYKENLEKILDINSTLYSLALLNIFSSLDSYIGSAHNYYLYHRQDTGQFVFLLWDANMAFGTFTYGLDENETPLNLDPFWTPTSTTNDLPIGARNETDFIQNEDVIENAGENHPPMPPINPPEDPFGQLSNARPLIENLLSIPEYNRIYLTFMAEILTNHFSWDIMESSVEKYWNLIKTDLAADPNALFTIEDSESNLIQDLSSQRMLIYGLKNFVTTRKAYLRNWLQDYANPNEVIINEIGFSKIEDNYNDSDGEIWVELYNNSPGIINISSFFLTDDLTEPLKWLVGNYSGNNHELKPGAPLAFQIPLKISEIESEKSMLYLFFQNENENEVKIDQVNISQLKSNNSLGRYPDGANQWYMFTDHPSPNSSNQMDDSKINYPTTLVINEILAENSQTIEDPYSSGLTADWIEIYNRGNSTVELDGLYLTDNLEDPTLWRFPDNLSLSAGEYLIIWASGLNSAENLQTNFKLSGKGEALALLASDGRTVIDNVFLADSITDYSQGRIPDGSETWMYYLPIPTPGGENVEIVDEGKDSSADSLFAGVLFSTCCLIGLIFIFQKRYRQKQKKLTILAFQSKKH
ncbi:MAG: CotH kinase family protein [Promethearchaeota archaeon]